MSAYAMTAGEPGAGPAHRISRDTMRRGVLLAPALLLVIGLVVLPGLWLFALSFIEKGHFSFAHYERMLTYSSYYRILIATFRISLVVTLICIVLGFPVAYLMAQLPARLAVVLTVLVILPLWTSVLVRTYAWLVLLTDGGPINRLLLSSGLIQTPLKLLFNETGTVIGMVHVMLPFFILPVYSAVRSFDWSLMQAAASLGAPPRSAFWRVFVPLALPGVAAGSVLVLVQCLGFFVTPAVLGGGNVTMASMKIASNIQQYFDWGAASAFGVVLLLATLGLLLIAGRFVSLNRVLGPA